jgi:hypothetical protein
LDDEQYRRVLKTLKRSGAFEAVEALRREAVQAEQQAEQQARAQQVRLAAVYNDIALSVHRQRVQYANNIAAQALRASHQSRLHAMELIKAGRSAELIRRATDLAYDPHTRELVDRADEVPQAPQEEAVEGEEVIPDELPVLPQMEWVFELNKESLQTLVNALFHLTGILVHAYGIALALSDRQIDTEEWATIIGALHVLFAYALLAMKRKNAE